jgi:transcriptional activator of cad operon
MERPTATKLRIGDWCVNPASGQISKHGESARVEVRTMRLLLCLAEHTGEVVSIDELLNQVWTDVIVAPDSVYQAVTSLRRLLGDDPKQPTYIATVPRLGYRMVASVSPWVDEAMPQTGSPRASDGEHPIAASPGAAATDAPDVPKKPGPHRSAGLTTATRAAGAALCLALVVAFLFFGKVTRNNSSTDGSSGAIAPQPQRSIAVLPFLDLTEEMN